MTNRMVGHDCLRPCNRVQGIRQAVVALEAAEQKAYDDQATAPNHGHICSRGLTLHSVGDV